MAKARCSKCGSETSLYIQGVPLCVKCDDELHAQAKAVARKLNESEASNKSERAKNGTGC
jgi:hypothetical protein